ncbi:MAG TPA: DGQHR domain-containing protein DpdB [Allosphingosinicella sp.]
MTKDPSVVVRAIKTQQADGVDVYAFFLPGRDILRVAQISRVERDEGDLKGFQRKEIRAHVKAIVEFLNSGPVLFPNAIILALSSEVGFKKSRGPHPEGLIDIAQGGYLTIPVRAEGQKVAWIVDGQQRSLALGRSERGDIAVPIVAFVSSDLETQRQQFIFVNRAKPLPTRLIDELLPEVSSLLPRDLSVRKLPSELINLLNRDPNSPFKGLIKRESTVGSQGIVSDGALVKAIEGNLKAPFGVLSHFAREGGETNDPDAAYQSLLLYWGAVRDSFPDAWGKAPQESRLMHSAGIRAMGGLMDFILRRAESAPNAEAEVRASLQRIAPHCAWTEGTWEGLGLKWNEVQSTPQDIVKLRDHLVYLDRELARSGR